MPTKEQREKQAEKRQRRMERREVRSQEEQRLRVRRRVRIAGFAALGLVVIGASLAGAI